MSKISLLHATEAIKKQTIEKIVAASSPVPTYFLLLVLSSAIVTIGLMLDNAALVIGGMLVSPLLSPILSIAMGIVIADYKLLYRSLYVLLKSVSIVFVIGVVFGFITEFNINPEILSRSEASLVYFYVAVASGIAASFAYIKEEFEERFIGIAVAIALLPPLSVTGLGVAMYNKDVIFGSLELFVANFIGIVLSAVIIFSLFKFHTVQGKVEEELQEEEKKLAEYQKEKEEAKEQLTTSIIQEGTKKSKN